MSGGERRQAAGRDAPGRDLARFRALADLLDRAFRVPGTNWRFGLDAVLGLLPGAGDVLGLLLGTYGLWVARRLGAPASVQWRMLANLALDALGGALPIAGDLFDAAFKANQRNRALLERWLADPRRTETRSLVLLVALPLALLALALATVALAAAGIYFLVVSLSM